MWRWLLLFSLLILLSACSQGRYQLAHDQAPPRTPTAAELVQPEPRFEPLSPRGNSAYEVFGQHYEVLPTAKGYEESGIASWYGQKFHGHQTSSGEYYDMYSISAAHRSLPLPSFVRVTNLANNKELVVRVNDRGPFHPDRIIDLSYGAAYKLGVLETGTAPVHLEAIYMPGPTVPSGEPTRLAEASETSQGDSPGTIDTEPDSTLSQREPAATPTLLPTASPTRANDPRQAPAEPVQAEEPLPQYYIQLAAAGNPERLRELQQELTETYPYPATTAPQNGLYRLLLGPFPASRSHAILDQLREAGFTEAFRVARASLHTDEL